ncbi:MAG: NADH-quinone oxidoreductase subunit L, partial [Pseudomonadota bacterium]
LRRELPVTFWTFVVGSAALASVPLITAGFYSKDAILWYAYSSELGGPWLWAGGTLGAFLTGLYAFRAVCLTFLGSCKTAVTQRMGPAATVPLVILAVFSLVIGFIELPPTIADVRWFSSFMSTCLPNVKTGLVSHSTEVRLQIVCAVIALAGVVTSMILFRRGSDAPEKRGMSPTLASIHALWLSGWGFDRVYEVAFVRPFLWIAKVNAADIVDGFFSAAALVARSLHIALSLSHTGRVRQYVSAIALGGIAAIWIVVFR